MLSCFVRLDQPGRPALREIEQRADLLRQRISPAQRSDFDDAFSEIREYLRTSVDKSSRGCVIYSRWGDDPVFLPLQFKVPVSTDLVANALPHIYPLIELKDTCHRFIVVVVTRHEARILETAIGAVTQEILKERPDLRERIGREWTMEHYQNHKNEREQQFIREKVSIIEELMGRRGYNHLIVAGSVPMVNRLVKALPPRLQEKVVTTFSANPSAGVDPIMMEALAQFIRAENEESLTMVNRLESSFLAGGLAVVGYESSRQSLLENRADILIIDQDYGEPELREELVRLATAQSVPIETVQDSETLQRLGGVGCLLRYKTDPNGFHTTEDLAA